MLAVPTNDDDAALWVTEAVAEGSRAVVEAGMMVVMGETRQEAARAGQSI